MRRPIAVVLSVASRGFSDLARALKVMSHALGALRVHGPTFGIARFVGGIHPKLARNGRQWNVHIHGACEASPACVPALEAFWKRATRGAGKVLHDERRPGVYDADSYANYVADEKDWSPAPDLVDDDVLEIMIEALRHRRLVVRWGFRRRRRRWRIPKV